MGSKTCARCATVKPLEQFAKKRKNDHQPYCRGCQAEYRKEHYQKNRAKYIAAVRKRRSELLEILREAKNKPCMDCGRSYPYYVMDLDHREGEDKLGNFTEVIHWGAISEARLRAEIAKCDIVCSNCHRIRTHERGQSLNKKCRKSKHQDTLL